ncbi:hypothetical protein PUN28_008070 [Cardiocondyla obscurior]|uniref:Uncharacterized protein n=1 Tax=Cardiocondyla obscurior TaxID=286306 RepID=A0AAW2FVZ1_9HYME
MNRARMPPSLQIGATRTPSNAIIDGQCTRRKERAKRTHRSSLLSFLSFFSHRFAARAASTRYRALSTPRGGTVDDGRRHGMANAIACSLSRTPVPRNS